MLESKLKELGLELPAAPKALGSYVPAVQTGKLLYVSGMLPMKDGKLLATGPVTEACSIEEAQQAARQCALNILAVVNEAAGGLDKIARVVQLQGFIYGPHGFADSPKVLNGASDLMVALLGESGRHSRAAVGVAGLPMNAAVEVTAVVELK